MKITVDRCIDPRLFEPMFHVRVSDIPMDLMIRKQNGEDLSLIEFAIVVLIEAQQNA